MRVAHDEPEDALLMLVLLGRHLLPVPQSHMPALLIGGGIAGDGSGGAAASDGAVSAVRGRHRG